MLVGNGGLMQSQAAVSNPGDAHCIQTVRSDDSVLSETKTQLGREQSAGGKRSAKEAQVIKKKASLHRMLLIEKRKPKTKEIPLMELAKQLNFEEEKRASK